MSDKHLRVFPFHQFQYDRSVLQPAQLPLQQKMYGDEIVNQMERYALSDGFLAQPTKFHRHTER